MLAKKEFRQKDYTLLKPVTPWYFLIKRNTKEIEHYNEWPRVDEIFPVNSVSIVTAKDEFVISFDKHNLENRIRQFRNTKFENSFFVEAYGIKNSEYWNFEKARQELLIDKDYNNHFTEVQYRLFDNRFLYYSPIFVARMRFDVMQNMLRENIALLTCRQTALSEWQHAFVSDKVSDDCTISNKTKERTYIFPLYLYPPAETKKKKGLQSMILFEPEAEYGKKGKKPNIAPKVFEQLEKSYKKKPTPEQIMYYCYAVLCSNIFREKYTEFLKIDFPRIPFTTDYTLFQQLAKLGEELGELHLLKHKSLNHPTTKYFGKGDSDKIEKPMYDEEAKRVYINEARYFDNISSEVWNYQVGGYQPMEKYLKDRKGRQMDDPGHYCKMATALAKTIEVQNEIDKLFSKAESKVIEMN